MPHLLETYALQCGAKIDKPFIYSRFFPLVTNKYITLHAASKYSIKSYDLWSEVVQLLKPYLDKEGIDIVQIGGPGEKDIPGCINTQGQTDLNQCSYIIKGAVMHVGVDSQAAHVASGFGKRIVCLYANNHINCVKPYWTDPEHMTLLEPDRKGGKPKFVSEEHPKSINTINVESIAQAVLDHLGLNQTIDFKTLHIGPNFQNKVLEWVPDGIAKFDNLNVETLFTRLDWIFDVGMVEQQFKLCNQIIVTDKAFDPDVAKRNKDRLKEVLYFVRENDDAKWCQQIQNLGVPVTLISDLPDEEITKRKANYLDVGRIHAKRTPVPDSLRDLEKFHYKSNKLTISRGKIFPSKQDWLAGRSIDSINAPFLEITPSKDFWPEMEYFFCADLTSPIEKP